MGAGICRVPSTCMFLPETLALTSTLLTCGQIPPSTQCPLTTTRRVPTLYNSVQTLSSDSLPYKKS